MTVRECEATVQVLRGQWVCTLAWALCAGLAIAVPGGAGATTLERGAEVYRSTCNVCHDAGVARAPRMGDRQRWARLGREGQVHVTAHGWAGTGAMPAQGGRTDLSLEDFAAAVVYMARGSGLAWQQPSEATLARIAAEAKRKAKDKGARAKP